MRLESENERLTFTLDSGRLAIEGITETLTQTVVLLVAIQFFDIPDALKGLIASASFLGYIVSLFYTSAFSGSRFTKSTLVTIPTFIGAAFLVAASVSWGGTVFAVSTSLFILALSTRQPFFLGIYEELYGPSRRGSLLSYGLILMTAVGIGASFLFGELLERSLTSFRWICAVSGILVAGSALLLRRIPSSPPSIRNGGNPLRNLKTVFEYPAFGYVLASWFIFGFANLWSAPLRMVYVAEAERGLGLSPLTVLFIMGVIPNIVRLPMTWVWARLFDRHDFIKVRIMMNGFAALGLLLFFLTRSIWVILTASVLINVGLAGARIAWTLWVTRFAPPGKSQVFMSVHAFLTGLRGIIGPQIGFLFVGSFPMKTMGFISFGLAAIAILMLLPFLGSRRPEAV